MARKKTPELGDRDVLIENIGPIEHLAFPAPPGSIVVLRGCNGVGKSQALAAVDALTTGNSKLSGRDGTTGGTARGFGVKIAVGRGGANRRSGDLVVESIEDRLNIADLVDPGLKDPVAADGRRIRALVQLSGVTPSLSLFEGLLGEGRLVALVPEEAAQASDLVDMAARVKRALEAHARKKEDEATGLRRDAEAKVATTQGIDLTAPSDRAELQQAVTDATTKWATLRQQRETGLRDVAMHRENLQALEEARRAVAECPTVEECQRKVKGADEAVAKSAEQVEQLKRDLATAEANHRTFKAAAASSRQLLETTRTQRQTLESLETVVNSPAAVFPTEAEVAEAFEAKRLASTAVETGVRVRDAQAQLVAADLVKEKADEAAEAAEELRDAARGTEDVLSRIVAEMGGAFKVDSDLRLVVPGTERGEEYFSELSHGERWKLAISVAIAAFQKSGKPGLLALPQESWEGLDGRNRQLILEAIDGTDISIITAEADHESEPSDEIEAKVYEPAGAT